MTELINKSLDNNILRIQWDCYPDSSDTQTLVLFNQFNKEVVQIPLGTNYSIVNYRYGKYQIPKSVLDSLGDNLPEGLYLYQVFNTGNLDCKCNVLTEGNLKVIRSCNDPIEVAKADIEYAPEDEGTGYVTYNG